MRAQGEEKADRQSTAPRKAAGRPSPYTGSAAGILGLQSAIGNRAVLQMLRAAGNPWVQDERQHSAGCGHQGEQQPAVQRSTVPGVLRSSGRPLDEATRTEMAARMGGADFSAVRIHDDSAAKASAAEVGARAYTSGNHIVIGEGGGDKRTLAHELTHTIQQSRGPVAGTDNGDGLRVSDPSDRFEREAEANASRVMAATAPGHSNSADTQPHALQGRTDGASATVQRMPAEGGQHEEDWKKGRLALHHPDHPVSLSAEDHVAGLPEDSEAEVFLTRGVTPTQKMYLQKDMIRGSFISFSKMLQEADAHAGRPEREHAEGYVKQTRNDETAKLVEFSTDPAVAKVFSEEARLAYLVTVRIKKKYLVKGSSGEKGWIAKQSAPFEIVAVRRTDRITKDVSMLTEDEFQTVVKNEKMAEFLHSIQDTAALAAHMARFQGTDKGAEAQRIAKMKKDLAD